LDESFGFSVGFRGIWSGSDVFEVEFFTGIPEGEGFIAGAIIGHDARDGNTETGIVNKGCFEEGHGTLAFLVGHNFAECDPRCVIDADMDELPACATAFAAAFASG
jgi:hypothetical protein